MGNPDIATALNRYPVANSINVTWVYRHCSIVINVYSEACRWNEHPIYQAVMTRHDEEVCDVQSFNSRQCYRKNGKTICQCKFHVYSNVYYIYPNIVSFKGLDECLYAKVTPLYNPWQYASIMKRSLPLYIEEGSYILGTYEDIPVTSIITRVGPPHSTKRWN